MIFKVIKLVLGRGRTFMRGEGTIISIRNVEISLEMWKSHPMKYSSE
jgi:hypothetical protein